ncbi:MAG: adenosine deaminase [bacterium]|nr:adenosine deaminase [bacterium]
MTPRFSDDPRAALKALPKAELHVHLEGFMDLEAWAQMTQRQASWTPQRQLEMEGHFAFKTFPFFLKCFGAVIFSFEGPEDFYQLTQRALSQLIEQGVVYAEVMLTPAFFVNRGIDFFDLMAEIHRAAKEVADRIELKLIFDGARNFGPESVAQNFKLAAQDRTGLVIGAGLGGDEANFPARLFKDQFDWAKAQGLRLTCHAGEAAGEGSMIEAVELLGADRLGHALGLVPGSRAEALVLERQVTLDLCPHSNLTTGVISSLKVHPLPSYLLRGYRVTLNSDDPGFFGSNLLDQYFWAAEDLGLDWEVLKGLARSSFEGSFLSPAQRQIWLDSPALQG